MPQSHPPTYEALQAEVARLNRELAQRAPFTPTPAQPHSSSEHTVVTETPEQTTLTTTHLPPTAEQFAVRAPPPRPAPRLIRRAPEEILGEITGIRTVIVSGVNAAGYGDKRTDFRSLAELRQILNGLEEELDEAMGRGGRIRQIRMTTTADKAL